MVSARHHQVRDRSSWYEDTKFPFLLFLVQGCLIAPVPRSKPREQQRTVTTSLFFFFSFHFCTFAASWSSIWGSTNLAPPCSIVCTVLQFPLYYYPIQRTAPAAPSSVSEGTWRLAGMWPFSDPVAESVWVHISWPSLYYCRDPRLIFHYSWSLSQKFNRYSRLSLLSGLKTKNSKNWVL